VAGDNGKAGRPWKKIAIKKRGMRVRTTNHTRPAAGGELQTTNRVRVPFYWMVTMMVVLTSCQDSGFRKYTSLMKKELASGKRVDSVFFGIYLGMGNKEFYMHCWDLNKRGIFTDGLNNAAVLYKLEKNELKHPAAMNFYPDFTQHKISRMKVSFQYNAWAPWNKKLNADSLLPDVLRLYHTWYKSGNPFIRVDDEKRGTIYVKVDGNRRITIGKSDDMMVKVDYTDLSAEN
jgi:hypothetical protein